VTKIIKLDEIKKQKERKRWNEIFSELEQQIELKENDGPNTPIEQKGIKNFKNLVKKLRQKHCED
jgi:hypothetical protein